MAGMQRGAVGLRVALRRAKGRAMPAPCPRLAMIALRFSSSPPSHTATSSTARPTPAENPHLPPVAAVSRWLPQLYTGAACFAGVGAITLPHHLGVLGHTDIFSLIAPFGASACLVFAAPDSPVSQPRQVVGGHVWSALAGMAACQVGGWLPEAMAWAPAPLAVAFAVVGMQQMKLFHPPAAGTAVLSCVTAQPLLFALTPAATGSLMLVLVGVLCNKFVPGHSYPKKWF